ncbi:MAG: hypothetical protein IAE94_06755 [Chthoniobacterales bacterium]|nr:hypothetical protein [Chthoniobacterales bacterium]
MDPSAILSFARELAGRELDVALHGDATDWYRFRAGEDGLLRIEADNARGVLYAVYDSLAGKEAGEGTPEFAIRGINPCESLARHTPAQLETLLDRMGRWRMNTLIIHSNYGFLPFRDLILRETRRRGIDIVHYTYSNLCFMEGLAPEHYARDASGNPKWTSLQCETRLCASNEEALRKYREGLRSYLERHPDYERMIFTTADGCELCECPGCRTISPIGQWQAIFDPFFDAAHATHQIEMLSYVQRFSVPGDLSRIRQLPRVLFDSHLRFPRTPLGQSHEWMKHGLRHCFPPDGDPIQDPRGDVPINTYLWDRLLDWRGAFDGQLSVFENLMVQGIWGCPRPNTSVYLDDLRNFRKAGINGVIYECFEPGITPFLPTFDAIARTMWDLDAPHVPTDFEAGYLADGATDGDFLAMHPGHEKWALWRDRTPRAALAVLLYRFHREPSVEVCHEVLHHILNHPEKEDHDWIYIAQGALKKAFALGAIQPATPREAAFLNLKKLWDFQELHHPSRESAIEVIHSLWTRMKP